MTRNKIILILGAIVIWLQMIPVFALTEKERTIVQVALEAVDVAIEQGRIAESHGKVVQEAADAATSSALLAKAEAIMAKRSALATEQKAIKAEQQAAELKAQNDLMFPVYEQVNKWCGFGAFAYGIKKLMKCFLWFLIGGTVIAVALFFLAPAVLPAVGGFFIKTIPRWFRLVMNGIKKLRPSK